MAKKLKLSKICVFLKVLQTFRNRSRYTLELHCNVYLLVSGRKHDKNPKLAQNVLCTYGMSEMFGQS